MATVTYNGESYTCTTALKGTDYIHLLDASDNMTVAFDGVSDFTGFSISGGDWTTPTADGECYVAVVTDDGSIHKGSHTCSDIHPITASTTDITAGTTPLPTGELYLVYS